MENTRTKLIESCLLLNEAKKKKVDKLPLTPAERDKVKSLFGDNLGCSFFKTSDGKYYCTTHRARGKFYDNIEDVPKKEVDFISSTS